jgi:hypothetical protein
MSQTKGERLITGIEQLRDGLTLINGIGGSRQDFIKLLVSSTTATSRLRDLLHDNALLKTMVFGMVAARNSKLVAQTVEKVIGDFMDVLFDLSQPTTEDGEDGTA